jgi:hypothetical protein
MIILQIISGMAVVAITFMIIATLIGLCQK